MSEYTSSLQRQIESLSAIIELWVPVLEEMKTMQRNLEELPVSLAQLKQQLAAINDDHSTQKSEVDTTQLQELSDLQQLEPKLRHSVSNLEAALPQMAMLEKKIRNLIALKERLEALQENIQAKKSPNYAAEFARIQHSGQNMSSHQSVTAAEALRTPVDEERKSRAVFLNRLSPDEEDAWLQFSLATSKHQHRLVGRFRPRRNRLRRTSMWLGFTLLATVLISFGTVMLVKHAPIPRESTDSQINLPRP